MKKFLISLLLLPALAFGHGAPVIWNGANVTWLNSGLNVAGMCKTDANGVMTPYTTDGIIKMSSGVPGAAASGTDYAPATSGTDILKGNGSGGFSSAVSGTDYAPATSGTGYLKGNGSGGFTEQSTPIPLADGGTNKNLSVTQGGILYTDSDSVEVSSAGTSGQAVISGGTGAPSYFAPTAGSVLFAGTGGILAEDNSDLFWDAANFRLGVGTASPSYRFHVEASADNYLHGMALSHALGGANSLWRLYPDLNGTFSIANPAQSTVGVGITHTGILFLAGGTTASGGSVNIRPNVGRTTDHSLAFLKLASQTGDFIRAYDTDVATVLFKVDIAGKGTFSDLRVDNLGAGIAHVDANGDFTSSAVALGSDVSGTLPVGNGGTGITSGTSGGVPYFSASNTIASSGALDQYQVVLGGGAGAAPNVVSGTGTSGQVLTSNGAGANPTWQDASGGSTITVSVKTADYTMTNSDDVIIANCTSECVITMQAVSGATVKPYKIKNVGVGHVRVVTDSLTDLLEYTAEYTVELPAGGLPKSAITLIPVTGGSSWAIF